MITKEIDIDGKKFPYTEAGKKAAKKAMEMSYGVKVQYKNKGGKVGYNPLGNCGLYGRK